LSATVRGRPLVTVAIVTHLVTRSLKTASPGSGTWSASGRPAVFKIVAPTGSTSRYTGRCLFPLPWVHGFAPFAQNRSGTDVARWQLGDLLRGVRRRPDSTKPRGLG
jgi:hypothetical protein